MGDSQRFALSALLVLALVGALAFNGLETHRTRVAAEKSSDSLGALLEVVKKPVQQERRARCPKEASHLDHDVDMGPIVPCPNPADGECVGGVAVSVAEAHCKAGKP